MPSIVFVRSGNIFHHRTTEYTLNARLNGRSAIRVSSAGTVALAQDRRPDENVCEATRDGSLSRPGAPALDIYGVTTLQAC
jgi:protein-tyrosine-phosphatase